jgi:SHS2 domain-containing protein
MYEMFEHTADLGLRIQAPTLDIVFAEAGEALFAAIVEDPGAVTPVRCHRVRLENDDRELLLFDWLNELLYQFDTGHWVFGRFEAKITGGRLEGCAWGEPLDRTRHLLSHEVKAITYHGLRLEQTAAGWLAEVIVDI